jgi:hypothetical protein
MDSGLATIIAALIGGISSVAVALIANRAPAHDHRTQQTHNPASSYDLQHNNITYNNESVSLVGRIFLYILYLCTAFFTFGLSGFVYDFFRGQTRLYAGNDFRMFWAVLSLFFVSLLLSVFLRKRLLG